MTVATTSPSRVRRLAATLAAAAIMATGLVVAAPSTPASAAPFVCAPHFFYVAGNQLYSGNPATVGFDTAIGGPNPTGDYNALGYNPLDDYLYGIGNTGDIAGQLVRIEDDGAVVALGVPAGAPLPTNVNAGEFDADGYFWVASGAQVLQIDVGTNTIVKGMLPSVPGLQGPDLVVHDGNIIRLKSTSGFGGLTQISTIDTATGAATWTTGSTIPAALTTSISMWLSGDARLFVGTNGGQIYELLDWQTNTPSALLRSTSAISGDGDGAMCQRALSPFGIVAQDDDYTGIPLLASEGGVLGNIWSNDTLDSAVATNTNVVTTITDDGGLVGFTIGTDGSVTVPAGFAPGTYEVGYEICSVEQPDECDTATITVLLTADAAPELPATGSELAATGSETSWLTPLGAGTALLGGIALTFFAVRRKRAH